MSSQDGTSQNQTVSPDIDERLETKSIAETLPRLKECSLFSDAIHSAGLEGVLGYSGLQTLFAPDNAAIGKNPVPDIYEYINEHLVEGAMRSDDLSAMQEVTTASGHSLPVQTTGGQLRIGDSTVRRADVQCTNGVIHVIGASA